jgi:hypothetical protein
MGATIFPGAPDAAPVAIVSNAIANTRGSRVVRRVIVFSWSDAYLGMDWRRF